MVTSIEFSEKMGIEVGNAFKSGYNCSEAIVEAFRKYAGVNIDDNAFRLASGFGGGIGHARNICGALVGCTMVTDVELLFAHLYSLLNKILSLNFKCGFSRA